MPKFYVAGMHSLVLADFLWLNVTFISLMVFIIGLRIKSFVVEEGLVIIGVGLATIRLDVFLHFVLIFGGEKLSHFGDLNRFLL